MQETFLKVEPIIILEGEVTMLFMVNNGKTWRFSDK